MTELSKAVLEAQATKFVGNSMYRVPYSRELEGKSFEFIFDDGYELTCSFPMRDKMLFKANDDDKEYLEDAYCMKAQEGFFFVLCEIAGSVPRKAIMLMIDVDNRLVTGNFALQGTKPEFMNLVTRQVRFGAIKDGEKPLPTKRTGFTHDLEGKKIEWRYDPKFSIIHVYLADSKYTVAFPEAMKAQMAAAREAAKANPEAEQQPRRRMPIPYWEHSVYVKLRENLYMFSFIEENLGSGTEGLFVIDTDRLHDVGCFWGAAPDGSREGYCLSAYGTWIREHYPEDDTIEAIRKKEKEQQ